MNAYPILGLIRIGLSLIGWAMAAIGFCYYVVYEAIIEPNLPDHHFGLGDFFELLGGLV